MFQQNSKIKILYFSEEGKRVSQKNILDAFYIQFIGRGIDDFFLLPPREKEGFVNQLKIFVKRKKEAKNFRAFIYDKIGSARYFTVKHKNQELFTDEFPTNMKPLQKEKYIQEILKETKRIINKKEKLVPIEQLPIKTKERMDEITIVRSVNSKVNDKIFKTYISDLSFGVILLTNKKEALKHIEENIELGVENCLNTIRKGGLSKSENLDKYNWRITVTFGEEDIDSFTTSSSVTNTLAISKEQVIDNIKANYDQNKTEGYEFAIKELFLRRIKVTAYEEIM
jgi:hypothetical protein